jgi:hypothetical protein
LNVSFCGSIFAKFLRREKNQGERQMPRESLDYTPRGTIKKIIKKKERKHGEASQRQRKKLSFRNYDQLSASEIKRKLQTLPKKDLEKLRRLEKSHKDRKSVLHEIDRKLTAA